MVIDFTREKSFGHGAFTRTRVTKGGVTSLDGEARLLSWEGATLLSAGATSQKGEQGRAKALCLHRSRVAPLHRKSAFTRVKAAPSHTKRNGKRTLFEREGAIVVNDSTAFVQSVVTSRTTKVAFLRSFFGKRRAKTRRAWVRDFAQKAEQRLRERSHKKEAGEARLH